MVDNFDLSHQSENSFDTDKDSLNSGNIAQFDTPFESSPNFESDQKYFKVGKVKSNKVSTSTIRFNEQAKRIEFAKNIYAKANTPPEPPELITTAEPNSDKEEKSKLSCRKMADLFEEVNKFLVIDKTLNIYDKKHGLFVPLDKENSNTLIRRQAPEEMKDRLNTFAINEIVLWIQSKTYWNKIDGEKLKQINSNYINFQNCTLQLPLLEIHEHNPDFYCTNILSINYSRDYCDYRESLFFRVLEDLFSDDYRKINLLQEIFAVAIASIPLKHFYYFYGVSDSGKSKIADVLVYIMGSEYTSALTLKRLDTQFGLGGLYRKRLNIAGESNEITIEGMEITKRITGGDYTLGEKKYESAFEFYPQAALIFMSNHKLKVLDGQADRAFLNRMVVLKFSHAVPIEKQDGKLSLKLKSPKEINAIISWALEGVQRLYRNNFKLTRIANSEDYILNDSAASVKNGRQILASRFREYLHEIFDINPKNKVDYVPVVDIFDGFKAYIGINEDFEYKDSLYLHDILQSEFNLEKKRVKPTGQKQQVYVYFGLTSK